MIRRATTSNKWCQHCLTVRVLRYSGGTALWLQWGTALGYRGGYRGGCRDGTALCYSEVQCWGTVLGYSAGVQGRVLHWGYSGVQYSYDACGFANTGDDGIPPKERMVLPPVARGLADICGYPHTTAAAD